MTASDNIREVILVGVNKVRECGIYLRELKESVRHGEFEKMFSDHGDKTKTSFPFTAATARNYMRFATANSEEITELPEGIRSIKDAMIASGALPARTHENQESHTNESNFFIAAGKQLMAFSSSWEKQMKLHPVANWNRETAEQFVAQLEPIVEKVNNIYATAKARSLSDD